MIVGISTYRGTYLLPPVLKRFRTLYPKVHVEICEMDSIDLEDQLLEGLLDLAPDRRPAGPGSDTAFRHSCAMRS